MPTSPLPPYPRSSLAIFDCASISKSFQSSRNYCWIGKLMVIKSFAKVKWRHYRPFFERSTPPMVKAIKRKQTFDCIFTWWRGARSLINEENGEIFLFSLVPSLDAHPVSLFTWSIQKEVDLPSHRMRFTLSRCFYPFCAHLEFMRTIFLGAQHHLDAARDTRTEPIYPFYLYIWQKVRVFLFFFFYRFAFSPRCASMCRCPVLVF